jgi:hypothetical protein
MNFKTNFLKCILIVSLSLTTLFAKAQTPDPNTTVLCAGQTRTLTSVGTGATYQWYKDGVLISGATAQSYNAAGAAYPGAAYTVVALNAEGCSSDASDPIYVVNAPVAVPVIAIANNSSCQTATNDVVLTGSGVPTAGVPTGLTYAFEWKKVGSATVVGTGTTLTLKNVAESGQYTLTLTPVWKTKSLSCAATSAASTVTIYPFAAKATIATAISGYQTADEKRSGIVCEFNTVTFTASVSSTDQNITTTGLTYQWYKNGVAIVGETKTTLVLTNVGSTNNGSYTVKTKTTNNCEATSDASLLDVIARLSKPTISFID